MTDTHSTELRFLNYDAVRRLSGRDSYRVMVYLPTGQYPEGTITTPNAFFHADDRLVFSVTYGNDWRALDEDAPYSEFDWASPQELRLLASILLSEKRDSALVRFYPMIRFSPRIDATYLDFHSSQTVKDVRDFLLQKAVQPNAGGSEHILAQCFAKGYSLVSRERYNLDRAAIFWKELSVKNYVLMRGIYALIKAEMLACHGEFWEEAIIVSYIALESTFQLVCRLLKEAGISNPTSKDAAKWLYDTFDKPFGLPEPAIENYFEEFYIDRVRTLHPASRYGESPYSPIMHDDFCHLRRSLREIFAYLVTREHGPDYHEAVRREALPRLATT